MCLLAFSFYLSRPAREDIHCLRFIRPINQYVKVRSSVCHEEIDIDIDIDINMQVQPRQVFPLLTSCTHPRKSHGMDLWVVDRWQRREGRYAGWPGSVCAARVRVTGSYYLYLLMLGNHMHR